MKQSLILEKKRKSLDLFLSMLRKQGIVDKVEQILLYGSMARGDVDQESDIDVLLFARQPHQIADKVADISYETMLKTGDRIEAFVYPTAQFIRPKSYFIVRALHEGKAAKP